MLHRSKIAPKIETSINSQISLHFPIRSLLPRQHRSPPLSRGILRRGPGVEQHAGIIPALAGNTSVPGPGRGVWGDHPRSRGEYYNTQYLSYCGCGSSPLSRGIPLDVCAMYSRPRIIPALAGNTCQSARNAALAWDHPRSRGEYRFDPRPGQVERGSSPLSRGIPTCRAAAGVRGRIIPALAGNT